ncbi:MAG: efflux RND transporter permease subunit, partial [Pirellulales bacterium]|nr:efflux RND transporter permease subunit [Pirellulales bacterium]
MKWSAFAIRESRLTWFFILCIFFGGIFGFRSMPITEDPPFIFRFALVYTLLPGASPEQVDRLVTGPLEEVILELPELEYTESFSREGISLISVKLDDRYDDVTPIWEALRRKMEVVQPELPPGHIGPVVNAEFGEIFGILIGVSSSTLNFEALQARAQAMQEDLLLLSQVSQVTVVGQREEQVQVELDLESMSISGVSPFAIAPAIASRSQIIPGGRVPLGSGETMLLNPSGDMKDLDDLRDTPIPLVDEVVTLPLSDVAQVSKVLEDPPTEMVSIEGQPGLLLGVSLQKKGNIRLLGREIKQQIAYWETEYGKTIDFEIVTFEPGRIDATLGGLLKNLIQ